MKCNKCHTDNNNQNNFCVKCGNRLELSSFRTGRTQKGQRHVRTKQPKTLNLKVEFMKHKVVVLAAIALFGYFAYQSLPHSDNYENFRAQYRNNYNTLTSNITTGGDVNNIASMFICSCGKCKDSLEICNCEKAVEERNFIKERIDKKVSNVNITVALAGEYGFMKSAYAKDYNVKDSQVFNGI